MYREADNVTVPALIDDPDGGGDDPGLWANSSGYDSQPTSIYLIGTDTTFKFLVNFALMGWQMSYEQLDEKISELLDNTSNMILTNKMKTNDYTYSISNNKIVINGNENYSLKIFNLQGKEIFSENNKNNKQIDLSTKISKGTYLLNINFASGLEIKESFVIK